MAEPRSSDDYVTLGGPETPGAPENNNNSSRKKNSWSSRSVSGVDDLHFNIETPPVSNSSINSGTEETKSGDDTAGEPLVRRATEDYYTNVEVCSC